MLKGHPARALPTPLSRKDEMSETPFEAPETAPEPSPEDEPASPSVEAPGEGEGDEEEAAEEESEQTEQPPSEGEQESEPEEPQSLTKEELEKRDKAADKYFKTYTANITKLYAEDAVNLVPLTLSPSAPYGFWHKNDVGRIPEEITRPIMQLFGITVETEYEPDPNRPACDKCKGKGKIATGSLVPEYRTMLCDSCGGKGFVQPYVK